MAINGVPVKRNCYKYAFGNVVVRYGGKKKLYHFIIRSQCFSESMPQDY